MKTCLSFTYDFGAVDAKIVVFLTRQTSFLSLLNFGKMFLFVVRNSEYDEVLFDLVADVLI